MITIRLFTKPRSRKPTSVSPTAFCVETSSADVISSAMSTDGFISVEMTITVRCFIPPDSSIGNIPSTAGSSPTSSSRRRSSGSSFFGCMPWALSRSATRSPIFRVGLSALIAYCGTIDTVRKRKAFIAFVSQTGSSVPSIVAWPPT